MIVDLVRLGLQSAGNVNVGEAVFVLQKPAKCSLGIGVGARDLAAIVDADRLAGQSDGVRVIDGREVSASVLEVAVADEVVGAGDLASFVDVEDERAAGCVGGVDGGEDALVQQEPVTIARGSILIMADDLAAVVDAEGHSTAGVGTSIGVKAPLASRRRRSRIR